ncbi:MAG: hypothetical protein ACRDV6_00510 [Acidimicrobiales bacterium]
MLIEEPVPEASLIAFVCFRIEDADGDAAALDVHCRAFAPNGAELAHMEGEVRWDPGTAPQLVGLERHYLPIELRFPIVRDGEYSIEVSDGVSQPTRLPLHVSMLGI